MMAHPAGGNDPPPGPASQEAPRNPAPQGAPATASQDAPANFDLAAAPTPANNTPADTLTPAPRATNTYAPTLSLDEIRNRPAGFGDRGGRGGRGGRGAAAHTAHAPPASSASRGRGRGTSAASSPQFPAVPSLAAAPALAPAPAHPDAPLQLIAAGPAAPRPVPSQLSYADATVPLAPLEIAKVPADFMLAALGSVALSLPLLPKKEAHKYELPDGCPFAAPASKNFDTLDGYLAEEVWFKRSAMMNASRVVIVRTTEEASLPWMFFFAVQAERPSALPQHRITITTLAAEVVDVPGLAPPAADAPAFYLLQGTKSNLKAHARRVTLRGVIAGKADHERVFEAIGIPTTADWQAHLLGAPLHLVQHWDAAPQRATVKPVYEQATSLLTRFAQAGEFRAAFADHVIGAYLVGFNVRIIGKAPMTSTYKQFYASAAGIASVFTDTKLAPEPETIGGEPTCKQLEIMAATKTADEECIYGGVVTAAEPPDDLWDKIAVALGARVLGHNTMMAVFGIKRGMAAKMVGKVLGGWVRISDSCHG